MVGRRLSWDYGTARVRRVTVAVAAAVVFALAVAVGAPSAQTVAARAYVTNDNSDTVSVIDTATNTVVATVDVGIFPIDVAVSPDGTRAYVVNSSGSTVSVIDTATNTVVATLAVEHPTGVAVTPDGTRAYVTGGTDGTYRVSVIDTATNTVVATVGVGAAPKAVAITSDGGRAYVTNSASNTVSVINTATNTVVATVGVGSVPDAVAVTPDGRRVYVTNTFADTVSVIDTTTLFTVATVPVIGGAYGIAITPDGTQAYVVNGQVAVIDTATNAVVRYVGVEGEAGDVAVTPDGTRAYVTSRASNTVSVIDTTTNTMVATIVGGGEPRALAIGPVSPPPPTTTSTTVPRSVTGRAFGYSWFLYTSGGAAPTVGPIPTVTLPEGGSATPMTASAATGEALFGVGLNPFFTSGPITVSTQGTPAGGTVTSTTEVLDVNTSGLERLTADSLTSTCEATEAGVTRSATVTNGTVVTDPGDDDPGNLIPDHPRVVVDVPANPAPNTEIAGHFHDPFSGQDDFRYVFNEQVTSADGSPTVNAAHAYIEGEIISGELVIGQAVCDLSAAPPPTTTSTTTTTTQPPVVVTVPVVEASTSEGRSPLARTGGSLRLLVPAMSAFALGGLLLRGYRPGWAGASPNGRAFTAATRRSHRRRAPWDRRASSRIRGG